MQESPVLKRLEQQLANEYRVATLVAPWDGHDTVYVTHYSGSPTG